MYREHNTSLLRFLTSKLSNPHDAEDIAQDAYHNMLRIEEPDKLDNAKAYLFQTAANLALNRMRKRRRQAHHEHAIRLEADLESGSTTISPEQATCAQYELEAVLAAIDDLPERCRHAFLLSRSQGKNYQDISIELGVSVSTVEKDLIKALQRLRKQLKHPSPTP